MAAAGTKATSELQSAVRAAYADGNFELKISSLPIPGLGKVFNQVLGSKRLKIARASLSEQGAALVVTGSTGLLGSKNVAARVSAGKDGLEFRFGPASWGPDKLFGAAGDAWLGQLGLSDVEIVLTCPGDPDQALQTGLDCTLDSLELKGVQVSRAWMADTLTVRWAAPASLQLPGIDWFSLANLRVEVHCGPADAGIDGLLGVDLHAGDFVFPLAMPLPAGGDSLQLYGNFDAIPLPSLADVGNLLGAAGLVDNIPASLAKSGNLSITDFRLLLDPQQGRVPYLAVTVESSVRWPAIPGLLEFEGFRLQFEAVAAAAGKRALHCSLTGGAKIGGAEARLGIEFGQGLTFYGQIETLELAQLAQALIPDGLPLEQLAEIRLRELSFSLSTDGNFSFATQDVECDFGKLARNLGINLPRELESFGFDLLMFERNGDSWSIELKSARSLSLTPGDPGGTVISGIALKLGRDKTRGAITECSFVVDGRAKLSADVALSIDTLEFGWQQSDGKWTVQGGVTASIAGDDYPLDAAIEKCADGYSVALRYPQDIGWELFDGAAVVTIANLVFTTRKQGDAAAQSWSLTGAATIHVDHLLDASGSLSIQAGDDGTRLEISARAEKIPSIPLLSDFEQSPELVLQAQDLTLAYAKDRSGKSSWSMATAIQAQITKIPGLLEKYLPAEPLEGYLRTEGKKVLVGFDVPKRLQPEFPDLSLKFSNDFVLELGKPELAVNAIELELGADPRLVLAITAGLPAELNRIFGTSARGKPRITLFNDSFEFELALSKKLGLSAVTSPLKPLEFFTRDRIDGLWTLWDFGEFGRYQFEVPEFTYSGDRWKASGGFNRLDEFRLPLAPIKFLLESCQFPKAFGEAIPDSIELDDIDLTDKNFRAHIHALLGEVLKRLDKNLAKALDEALSWIEKVMDYCPQRLREYFKLKIPQSFRFDIAVDSTGGGTSVALRVEDGADPIQLLLPFMTLTPELLGLNFSGLAFGQKSGGALLDIRYDGHIDRFNLLELTVALVQASASKKPAELSNRLILSKTQFLLPSGLPIPVPIFFNELGLEYQDIFDTELETHWYYPDPEWGLFTYLKMLEAIYDFCTRKKYLLHEDGFGDKLNTNLTIGLQKIRLPFFLGGLELQPDTHNVSINTADSAARILDSLKTGNASYAIEAVPIKVGRDWVRVGSQQVTFGILVMKANWCIATQREYEETVLPAIAGNPALERALSQDVLRQLPQASQQEILDKGFIVILGGEVGLAGIAGLEGQFGLALTGGRQTSLDGKGRQVAKGGFETGFLLAGRIAEVLKLQIDGHVLVNPDLVQLDGAVGLYWQDRPLIKTKGLISVTAQEFHVEIDFILTPQFVLSGKLTIGDTGFAMSGEVMLAGNRNDYTLKIDNSGVHVSTTLKVLEFSGGIEVSCPGMQGAMFAALATIHPGDVFNKAFVSGIKTLAEGAAESAVEAAYAEVESAMKGIDGIQLDIQSLRVSAPRICDAANAAITAAINAAAKKAYPVGGKARQYANNAAKPFRDRVARIKTIAQRTPNDQFRPQMKAALQDLISAKNNQLDIVYDAGLVGKFKIYQNKQVIRGKNLQHLQFAVQHMDELPDKDGPTLKKEYLQNYTDKQRMMAEIKREVEGSIPQIESISFDTELGMFNVPGIDARLDYLYGGASHSLEFRLDLSSLDKAVSSVNAAFA